MTISQEIGTAVDQVVSELPLRQRLAFLQRQVQGSTTKRSARASSVGGDGPSPRVPSSPQVRRALEGRELIGKEFVA